MTRPIRAPPGSPAEAPQGRRRAALSSGGTVSTAYKMLVNGQWTDAKSGKTFSVTNPATEESIGTVPEGGVEDVDAAVKAARAALEGPWGKMSAADRGRLIWKVGEL